MSYPSNKVHIRVQMARAYTGLVGGNVDEFNTSKLQVSLQQVAESMFNNHGKGIVRVQNICCGQQSYQPCS